MNVVMSAVTLAAICFISGCERNEAGDILATDPYGLFPPPKGQENPMHDERHADKSSGSRSSSSSP